MHCFNVTITFRSVKMLGAFSVQLHYNFGLNITLLFFNLHLMQLSANKNMATWTRLARNRELKHKEMQHAT